MNKYDERFAVWWPISYNGKKQEHGCGGDAKSAIDSTNPTRVGMSVCPSILTRQPNAETPSRLPAYTRHLTVDLHSLCQSSASHQHAVAIVGSPCRRRNHVQCGTCACRRDQLFGVRSTLICFCCKRRLVGDLGAPFDYFDRFVRKHGLSPRTAPRITTITAAGKDEWHTHLSFFA